MSSYNVLNLEPAFFSVKAREILSRHFQYKEGNWKEILEANFIGNDNILIVRFKQKIDKSVIDKFPNLKLIFTATTGSDHIDTDYCQAKNITIWSLRPHKEFLKTIPSTAEHAFGLMLSIIRNIPMANQSVKEGNWNRDLFLENNLKIKL